MNIHESIMFYLTELQDMTPGVLDGSTKWWNAAPGLPKQPTPRIAMWTNGLDLGPKMKVWNHMWFLFLRGDYFLQVRFSISPRAYNIWTYDEKKNMRLTCYATTSKIHLRHSTWGTNDHMTYPTKGSIFESMIFSDIFPFGGLPWWSLFLELFSTHHSPGWLGSQGAMVFQLRSRVFWVIRSWGPGIDVRYTLENSRIVKPQTWRLGVWFRWFVNLFKGVINSGSSRWFIRKVMEQVTLTLEHALF